MLAIVILRGINYEGFKLYSRTSVCKTCFRRVLDEQLSMSLHEVYNKCIYCIVDFLSKELTTLTRQRDDLRFSVTLLDHNYSEIHEAYVAAINDNAAKLNEIAALRLDLLEYLRLYGENSPPPFVNPNGLIG